MLQLFADIPRDRIASLALVRRIDLLPVHAIPSDEEVLLAFLEEGSLRRAANRTNVHHTTIDSRLKRIGALLQVDLSSATARLQVHLALELRKIAKRPALPDPDVPEPDSAVPDVQGGDR